MKSTATKSDASLPPGLVAISVHTLRSWEQGSAHEKGPPSPS